MINCGNRFSVEPRYQFGLDTYSRAIFDKPLSGTHINYRHRDKFAHIIIGSDEGIPPEQLEDNSTLKQYALKNTPRSGDEGLQDAVDQGYIKKLTQDEIVVVAELLQNKIEQRRMPDFSYQTSYIVLRNGFHYPAGIHRKVFIVPKGVDMPLGNISWLGDVSYYLNEIDCRDNGERSNLCLLSD